MVKVLFLAANPLETNRLMLGEEVNKIEDRIRRAELRDLFELKSHWALRVDEIPGLFLRHMPTIVHFAGHGNADGEIILDDGSGGSHPVPVNALGELFSIVKGDIRCVVLNNCHSARQAEAIAEHVECVIGMSKAVPDTAALSFASTFYEMMGYGKSVGVAFRIGCLMPDLKRLGDGTTPRLICRSGRADQIVLARKEVTDPPEVVSELTRNLIEGEEDERLAVAKELTTTVRKSMTALLIERSVYDPSASVRYWLNRALGKIGTPTALEVLRDNLTDPDVFAALGAEDALAELDQPHS